MRTLVDILESRRGDTLIEVTFALAILSFVLLSSTVVTMRAFRLGQTAKERTVVSQLAQEQMEMLRAFRDNRKWGEFLYGGAEAGITYKGVLNAPVTTNCKVTSPCFHVDSSTSAPVDGGTVSPVPSSFIEIVAVPEPGPKPKKVAITLNYGFETLGGGAENSGHVTTTLVDLNQPPPPQCIPIPTNIAIVLDTSGSMTTPWQTTTRIAKLKQVATTFVNSTNVGPTTSEAIISFNSVAVLRQPLTASVPALVSSINALGTSGGTYYLNALNIADSILTGPRRRIIVFISDGINTDPDAPIIAKADFLKTTKNVAIYTIGINPGSGPMPILDNMAGNGGYFVDAQLESELTNAMSAVAVDINCNAP